MLRDSVAVVAVVARTRPRAILLAMITMRKSTHGFPFPSYMSMGLRLATLRGAGAPLICILVNAYSTLGNDISCKSLLIILSCFELKMFT